MYRVVEDQSLLCKHTLQGTVPLLTVSSHMTRTSLGPASMSIPQCPLTKLFAAVTHLFPGPTITLHGGMAGLFASAATP
jgi:hypothetical protein